MDWIDLEINNNLTGKYVYSSYIAVHMWKQVKLIDGLIQKADDSGGNGLVSAKTRAYSYTVFSPNWH